ncbi:hypothetical protein M885DRAFT_587158 [Pelagophyceae sp. CCMP2097]|nr:hypothetical protein M885DRAFT_587158 [Pelagophyceae sp. CCMP2097]
MKAFVSAALLWSGAVDGLAGGGALRQKRHAGVVRFVESPARPTDSGSAVSMEELVQSMKADQDRATANAKFSVAPWEEEKSVVAPAVDVPAPLRAKIVAYLAKRESLADSRTTAVERAEAKRKETMDDPAWRFVNYFFSLESLLPDKPVESDDGDLCDALAYTELERYGAGALIEPIMDCGGYLEVSRALGVTYTVKAAPKPYVRPDLTAKNHYTGRGLIIGSALEEELEKISDARVAKKAAEEAEFVERQPSARALLMDKPLNRWRPTPGSQTGNQRTQWPTFLAPLSLRPPARAYGAAAALAVALPSTRFTAELADQLHLGAQVLQGVEAAAYVAIAANAAAAAVALVRPPPPESSRAFAAIRALVGGPLALLE